MIFFALSLSPLLLTVSAEIGSSMKPGEIFNETWGDFNGNWGDLNGTWEGWPEEMHCCKYKMVGDYKYYLVNYPEAEDMRKQGMMLPRKCYNDCIYSMDMDNSGDLYCFARGRQDVMCYDEYEGYGSGMGNGSSYPMGSGYGMGSGYPMGSGYGMGSGSTMGST